MILCVCVCVCVCVCPPCVRAACWHACLCAWVRALCALLCARVRARKFLFCFFFLFLFFVVVAVRCFFNFLVSCARARMCVCVCVCVCAHRAYVLPVDVRVKVCECVIYPRASAQILQLYFVLCFLFCWELRVAHVFVLAVRALSVSARARVCVHVCEWVLYACDLCAFVRAARVRAHLYRL